MKLGTRSLLFGCHQLLIHPAYTLTAWVRLYGWSSLDFQILFAIFFHDWGYWGLNNMDGKTGSLHPYIIIKRLGGLEVMPKARRLIMWHSRHLSQRCGKQPSRLCWVDKLGIGIMPSWLWALLAWLSGEGKEYVLNPYGQDYVPGEGDYSFNGLIAFHKRYKNEWGPNGIHWKV